MSGTRHATRDEALDALALVTARLRGDDEALTALLDGLGPAGMRGVTTTLADMLAQFLDGFTPDPLAAVDGLRRMWTDADGGG